MVWNRGGRPLVFRWLKEIFGSQNFRNLRTLSFQSLLNQTTIFCYPLFHQMIINVGYQQVQFWIQLYFPQKLMCQLDIPFSVKILISPKFLLVFSVHFKFLRKKSIIIFFMCHIFSDWSGSWRYRGHPEDSIS